MTKTRRHHSITAALAALAFLAVAVTACAPGNHLGDHAAVSELPVVEGEALFHARFNGLDGIGSAVLPNGNIVHRFSLMPAGTLLPPNSQACGDCHAIPFAAAAGPSNTHVFNDPDLDGKPPFNQRSTTSLFGDGLLQLLAMEITEELQGIREAAAEAARAEPGTTVTRDLEAKGVSYGSIAATADAGGEVTYDVVGLEGVDPDLVIRPMNWKGTVPTVRLLAEAAAAFGLGLQAEDFVWRMPGGDDKADYDGDGVERELSTGDVTAITTYIAALETPRELGHLVERGWVAAPTADDVGMIERGRTAFAQIGCAECHVPEMPLENTVFEEPTMRGNGNYIDHFLVSRDSDYDPARPLSFDMLADADEPRVDAAEGGGATVALYGDLKRHAMGRWMAEPAGPSPALLPMLAPLMHDDNVVLVAPDTFLTAELWGVGNTGPWLHDGRAGTLREAIELHGEDDPVAPGQPGRSEAQESRDGFMALDASGQADVLGFLLSLTTFSPGS
jgi:hypothetical protein